MSHFFTPFFFYVLEEWLSNKLHVCRSRDSVRNGCAARIRSIRSFRGLGKLHQQAISRRYYLGTACQLVILITFVSDAKRSETRRNAIFISDEVDNSLKRKRGTNMNIFYDEKLVKEMEEEARLQAIFDRALEDPESLNEVSEEDQEKLIPYVEKLFHELEERFAVLKERHQKLLAELDEYLKMAEAEEMKMLAEMKEA